MNKLAAAGKLGLPRVAVPALLLTVGTSIALAAPVKTAEPRSLGTLDNFFAELSAVRQEIPQDSRGARKSREERFRVLLSGRSGSLLYKEIHGDRTVTVIFANGYTLRYSAEERSAALDVGFSLWQMRYLPFLGRNYQPEPFLRKIRAAALSPNSIVYEMPALLTIGSGAGGRNIYMPGHVEFNSRGLVSQAHWLNNDAPAQSWKFENYRTVQGRDLIAFDVRYTQFASRAPDGRAVPVSKITFHVEKCRPVPLGPSFFAGEHIIPDGTFVQFTEPSGYVSFRSDHLKGDLLMQANQQKQQIAMALRRAELGKVTTGSYTGIFIMIPLLLVAAKRLATRKRQ